MVIYSKLIILSNIQAILEITNFNYTELPQILFRQQPPLHEEYQLMELGRILIVLLIVSNCLNTPLLADF
jgi:hypothetical protein